MQGLGVPLATPFEDDDHGGGDVDHDALADLTTWVTDRGVDFLVPCGSNSEAELLTADERAAVGEPEQVRVTHHGETLAAKRKEADDADKSQAAQAFLDQIMRERDEA